MQPTLPDGCFDLLTVDDGQPYLMGPETEPAFGRFLTEADWFLASGDESGGASLMPAVFPQLTDREAEVLALVARGLGNSRIAERLEISEKTVRNHVTNIFRKIGATSRAEAIVRARDAGIGIDTNGAR